MARIVYTLGELMGSVGGLTFQRNRSGKIVRQRPTVGKKNTTKQQRSHQLHANALRGWQLLTNEQRSNWNTYALTWTKENKFGQTKTLTGANWYESVNFWRNLLSLALLTNPPAHDLPERTPTFEILLSDTSVVISFTSAHDYVTSPVIVYTTNPTSKSTNSINQIRKYVTIIDADPGATLNITALWETATGLEWNPLINFPSANIFVCLESVRASSGITSAMSCGKENTNTIITEEESILYYE